MPARKLNADEADWLRAIHDGSDSLGKLAKHFECRRSNAQYWVAKLREQGLVAVGTPIVLTPSALEQGLAD